MFKINLALQVKDKQNIRIKVNMVSEVEFEKKMVLSVKFCIVFKF